MAKAPYQSSPYYASYSDCQTLEEQYAWINAMSCDEQTRSTIPILPSREAVPGDRLGHPETTNIYFIGGECGPIKIGMAASVASRLKALQMSSPSILTVLAVIAGASPKLEREYHKRFAAHRLHGEWFNPHPDILAEIERLTSAGSSGAL